MPLPYRLGKGSSSLLTAVQQDLVRDSHQERSSSTYVKYYTTQSCIYFKIYICEFLKNVFSVYKYIHDKY